VLPVVAPVPPVPPPGCAGSQPASVNVVNSALDTSAMPSRDACNAGRMGSPLPTPVTALLAVDMFRAGNRIPQVSLRHFRRRALLSGCGHFVTRDLAGHGKARSRFQMIFDDL
jgi:hypothetical protein